MRTFIEQLIGRAIVLGAIALVAVGISGGLAAGFGATAGTSFVAGDQPGVTYSPARCKEYFEYVPNARTCEQAATEHHFGEVVEYRILAGVVGLAVLAASRFIRRRRPQLFGTDTLPTAFAETVAATAFGVVGTGMLVYGVDQARLGINGAGAWISGGIVALVAGIAYGVTTLRLVVPTAR